MKKNKKEEMNNQEDNNEEKKVGKIKLFFEYYKNVPAFKALVKLFLYFIFFAVIISVVAFNQENIKEVPQRPKTEEHEENQVTYQEMLNALRDNIKIFGDIKINEENYQIEANYRDKILSGIYRTKNSTHEFKIKEHVVYEISLSEEKENTELLKQININFLIPDDLITLLQNNKATKMLEDGGIIYNYEIEKTKYQVQVKDNWIDKIEIVNDSFSYRVEYSKGTVS